MMPHSVRNGAIQYYKLFNYSICSETGINLRTFLRTAWEVPVFGIFLVRIFPHLVWIRRVTEYIRFQCEKIRTIKTPEKDTFHAVRFKNIVNSWDNSLVTAISNICFTEINFSQGLVFAKFSLKQCINMDTLSQTFQGIKGFCSDFKRKLNFHNIDQISLDVVS